MRLEKRRKHINKRVNHFAINCTIVVFESSLIVAPPI